MPVTFVTLMGEGTAIEQSFGLSATRSSRSLPLVDVLLCSGIAAFTINRITMHMLLLIYTTSKRGVTDRHSNFLAL